MSKRLLGRALVALALLVPPVCAFADDGYDDGYDFGAESVGECQDEFYDRPEAEEGCIDAVREAAPFKSGRRFHGYRCTDDCSGHFAGWAWAERRGIMSRHQCGGRSQSFIEGCYAYVETNF